MLQRIVVILLAVASCATLLRAQQPVTPDRLLNTASEPQNYLTYGGDYASQRYSRLVQLTPANVSHLQLAWAYQSPLSGTWEATPIVSDGVMYVSQRMNDIV